MELSYASDPSTWEVEAWVATVLGHPQLCQKPAKATWDPVLEKQTNKEIIRILSTDPYFNKVKKNGKEMINIKTFEIVPPMQPWLSWNSFL